MQVADGVAVDAYVYVVPFAYLGQALDVVVGDVHAARVAYFPVDDHDLAVVAVGGVVEPGEGDGVELHDFDAAPADVLQVFLLERLVVRPVAERIEQGPHLHPFGSLLGQQVEQGVGDGVVAEVEIFQMDVVACAADGFEQVDELVVSVHQQFHPVVAGHGDSHVLQALHDGAVAAGGLGRGPAGKEQEEHGQDRDDMFQNSLHHFSFYKRQRYNISSTKWFSGREK